MILVVEDHEETRWVLLRLLERRGYEAMGVADGAAVLQLLRDQPTTPLRMIVLDHGLPRMDGLTVLRTVRGDERHRNTPVILYTASPLPSVTEAALRAGATDVVIKCGDWNPLLAAIARHAGPPDRASTVATGLQSHQTEPTQPTYAMPS